MAGQTTAAKAKAEEQEQVQVPDTPAEALTEGLSPDVKALMGAILEQNRLMAEQMTALRFETSDREREAAEAAAAGALPPASGDVEDGFEPVLFRSKGTAFRVVRVGRHRWTAPNGEAQISDGRDYEFVSGEVGASELWVRNSNVANFLRGRPTFNREFWEVGAEPHAAPDPEVVMEKIMAATVDMDDAALEELQALETASHRRPIVLKAIKQARAQIQRAGSQG